MPRNTSGLKRGGSPGRKPGEPNKATREMRAFARELLERPEMQEAAKRDIQRNPSGALSLFYHQHAYGKPKETVALENGITPLVIDRTTDADYKR